MIDRAGFLRLGVATVVGGAIVPSAASAGLPNPVPVGDDEGFLQFGALAERVSLVYYRRAVKLRGVWSGTERTALQAAARQKVTHVQQLTAALGADAPSSDDYSVVLPDSAFRTRAGTLSLGARLERLLVGVYVSGAGFTADSASRLLLSRLLANDAQHLAALCALDRQPMVGGLPEPVDLAAAGDLLDQLLKANGYPTT
ncbi:MAG TPA: ferritin-like domain-containing protein [Baekduia sp.]|uniref:ferritin-like domain-containing protein n=1 Tax=Baekduia sp. TaxID=2600305 RepID=UPI002C8E094E|nr:ferritin-like domain-containing protein [Baekduia sp.]HMJ37186.1 ferritin-like domain-containing protein [Baekduia sp.]